MTVIEHRGMRATYLVLVFTTLLAGDAVRYVIGWWGFAALVGALAVASVAVLVVSRERWSVGSLPYPLLAFLALATLSLAWSAYPGATALGLAATWLTAIGAIAIAITYSWAEILHGLGISLRILLGMSLLFELFVATVLRRPLLPLLPQPGIDYGNLPDPIPPMLFWSRNELFEVFDGGRIQGVLGNAVLLGFVALLGLIVFAIQLADRRISRSWGVTWMTIALACMVFSSSATITVAVVAVGAVTIAALALRRASTPRARALAYGSVALVIVVGAASAVLFQRQILGLLGKSEDLTGRLDIWAAVAALAGQRPAFGWGWVSYWVPWVEPFDTLVFRNGVRQLHAHNAWVDVWLQLGVVGLVVFGALVASAAYRSWRHATRLPPIGSDHPQRDRALTLLPLLVTTALLVQSLAESKLLVEYGLLLIIIVAVKTRRPSRLQRNE